MESKTNFIIIIHENNGLIYKVAKLYTNTKEDEEDLYQDIVYQLWKSFGNFRNESKISTWMYRVALNTSIAYLNKEKRKGKTTELNESHTNLNTEHDISGQERIDTLYAHIKKLNPIEKATILLYLEGKSYEEIAEVTGVSVTNVGTRLGRIRQKLSSQIKK